MVVLAAQKGVVDKDIREVVSHLSPKYRDQQGNDREAVKGVVLYYFYQHQTVSVLLSDLEILVEGLAATARFQAVMSGRTDAGSVLPEALGAYRFELSLEQEAGLWRVTSAKWEALGPPGRPLNPNVPAFREKSFRNSASS